MNYLHLQPFKALNQICKSSELIQAIHFKEVEKKHKDIFYLTNIMMIWKNVDSQATPERDMVRHRGIGDESQARALWADQGLYIREIREQ